RRGKPSASWPVPDSQSGGEALAHAGDAENGDARNRPAHAGNPARARVQRRRDHPAARAGRGVSAGRIAARRDGAVGWLVFDNPERRNAVSLEMWQAIPGVLDDFAADAAIRVVVLAGSGDKAFVSGADISQFERSRASPEAVGRYDEIGSRAQQRLAEFEKPTIAMIRGYCLGGGLNIALLCDLPMSADPARDEADHPGGDDGRRLRRGRVRGVGERVLRERRLHRGPQGFHGKAKARLQRALTTRRMQMKRAMMALAAAGAVAGAAAQNFPAKPITTVVGFGPGGGTDTTARIVAPALSDLLGQQVV